MTTVAERLGAIETRFDRFAVRPDFDPDDLKGAERQAFDEGWSEIERLRKSAIANILRGVSPNGKEKPPGGSMHMKSFRVLEDYTDKLACYLLAYGYAKALEYVAELWPGILKRSMTSFGEGVTNTKLLALEKAALTLLSRQKPVKRFNYWPNSGTASFFGTDACPLEAGLQAKVVALNLRLLWASAGHSKAVDDAFDGLLDYAQNHMERRLGLWSKAKFPDEPWWFLSSDLTHPAEGMTLYLLAMWQLTGREDYREGFLHYGPQMAGVRYYGKLPDGTEVMLHPHNKPGRSKVQGFGGSEMSHQDVTYCQESHPALLWLHLLGSPYHRARELRGLAHTMHAFSLITGYDGNSCSATIGGSFKNKSLDGQALAVTPKGERVALDGGKFGRSTETEVGITWKRGLHFILDVFVGTRYFDGLTMTAKASGIKAASIVKMLCLALDAGRFSLGD